ncbi:hypothetical protein [Pseudogulbenkiania sp. MAI-1]|uniref:hypothetical protein n=1 Tax=Pseudogulbenkiania sp. MAI-1 TaxID=990370 RepID=UPI00045E95A8|nr:hypothetical protein [Pseudogulbenkiania sp. MAI-1]
MNPSQKAPLPAGLELPVLTDVVEEAALPVLSEELPFELPDFDFSSELDEMATALPDDGGAVELDIPAELPLEDVLDIGPAPRAAEPAVDFSNLPSLDLEVASLDELALDEVLPELTRNAPPPVAHALSSGGELRDESFEFVLTPAGSDAAAVASGPSEPAQAPDDSFAIPELTMEWVEPTVAAEEELVGTAPSAPVELQDTEPAQVPDDSFAIPELTMEWAEPGVSVEAEEVVMALPEPVEPPSPAGELPSLAEGDAVVVESNIVVPEPWAGAISELDTELVDELAEPLTSTLQGGSYGEPEAAAVSVDMQAESDGVVTPEAEETVRAAPAMQRIDIESLPTGVLGGGVGPEPEAGGIHDQLSWGYGRDADESPEAIAAALSELEALLEPASEAIQPEPAVLVASESVVGEELPGTDVSPLVLDADAVGDVGEPILSGESDDGSEPAQPESIAIGPEFLSPATTMEQAAPVHVERAGEIAAAVPEAVPSIGLPEPLLASAMPAAAVTGGPSGPEGGKAQSCAVVDEQALIDSLTQKILPRMKVELSLWLQDALEMQARQMLSGVMHQLKEDYEMLFNETLRESLRQAISEIGRDEREGES